MASPNATECASNESVVLNIMGWAGCVAAWLLFVAPIPTMKSIIRAGAVGDFSPLPYLISMLQCSLWAVYALPAITPCKTQPLVTNTVGAVLEAGYVVVFIRYSHERRAMIMRTGGVVAAVVAVTAFAVLAAPHLPVPKWPDPDASRTTTVLGWTCSVFNVAMYASPLGVVRTVIQRRSVKHMPLLLTLGCGLCSGCWAAYALLTTPPDAFILAPNVAGLALFAVQITVYRVYSPFCGAGSAEDGGANKRESASASLVSATADDC